MAAANVFVLAVYMGVPFEMAVEPFDVRSYDDWLASRLRGSGEDDVSTLRFCTEPCKYDPALCHEHLYMDAMWPAPKCEHWSNKSRLLARRIQRLLQITG